MAKAKKTEQETVDAHIVKELVDRILIIEEKAASLDARVSRLVEALDKSRTVRGI